MNTKRLVTVAVLIALYTVLSLFSANLGLIKLTFESFPVLVASLMFGWVDGLLVGAVGGLLNQMLTYGFTVTTLMWILPNAVRGLLVGLYAKKHGLDLTMKPVSYTHLDVYKRQPLCCPPPPAACWPPSACGRDSFSPPVKRSLP